MASPVFLRSVFASARKAKLSMWLTLLFACALVLPWLYFAWLASAERADQIAKAEQNLAGLAAAYGEYAASLMRLGVSPPTDGATGSSSSPEALRGAEAMAAFRRALNVPDVRFEMHRIAGTDTADTGPDLTPQTYRRDGRIAAEIDRPAAGIATVASMSEDTALKEWRSRMTVEAAGFLARTFVVIAIGAFLVQQLRVRERLQADLVVAREAAEASSRAKSEFLANMSHELRTPLNAVIGFSEIVKSGMQGPLNARYREYGEHIFNSGTHLLGLINDILDLSKLEARQFELSEEDVDLAEVVEASLHLIEPQAQKANVALTSQVGDGLPLLRADNRRMRQIAINLLSNAVKFTPEGGAVEVSVLRKDGGLVLEVRDSGIGMTPEQVAKAQEPFAQIESKLSRRYEGTGLGLPLAKKLTEMHGGTLAIVSKPDAGTVVTVSLPRERIVESLAAPLVMQAAG